MSIVGIGQVVQHRTNFYGFKQVLTIIAGSSITANADIYALSSHFKDGGNTTAQAQITKGVVNYRGPTLRQNLDVAIAKPDTVSKRRPLTDITQAI